MACAPIPRRLPGRIGRTSEGFEEKNAWLSGSAMFESGHYWNEYMHSESVISHDCCPTTSYSNEAPSYGDYAVVWRSNNRVEGGSRFMFWNGASSAAVPDGSEPSLHGNMVAWVGRPESTDQIFYATVAEPSQAALAYTALAVLALSLRYRGHGQERAQCVRGGGWRREGSCPPAG